MTPFQGLVLDDRFVERVRLMLSTYQDGFGMQLLKDGTSLPGWRDFERVTAIALEGVSQENKGIFDVYVPTDQADRYYGISCKMRNMLRAVQQKRYVSIELSNSSGQFWEEVKMAGLTESTFADAPATVGNALLARVKKWHSAAGANAGGAILLDRSFYLVLSWDERLGDYQLHQFALELPEAASLTWSAPTRKRIIGCRGTHTVFEWYHGSGGQLKYYPAVHDAIWESRVFKLEPLPYSTNLKKALLDKVVSYYPGLWSKVV